MKNTSRQEMQQRHAEMRSEAQQAHSELKEVRAEMRAQAQQLRAGNVENAEEMKGRLRAKITIKGILIFAIMLLIIPTIIIYSIFAIVQTGKSTDKAVEDVLPSTVSMAANAVTKELGQYQIIAQSIADEDVLFDEDSTEEQVSALLSAKAESYGLLGVYAYDRTGEGINGGNCATSDYFNKVMAGETVIEEPAMDERVGQLAFSVAAPIRRDGTVTGVLECLVPQTALNELIANIKISDNNIASMFDSQGTTIADSDISSVSSGLNLITAASGDAKLKDVAAVISSAVSGKTGCGTYKYEGDTRIAAYAPVEGTDGWSMVITAPEKDFHSYDLKIRVTILILAVAFILYAFFGLGITIPRFAKPLALLVNYIGELSKGNFALEMPDIGDTYKDLVTINGSIKTLRNNTVGVIGDIQDVLGAMADGDFTVDSAVPEMYVGEYKNIYTAECRIKQQLSGTLTEILGISEQVSSSSDQVSNGAQALAQGATQQASSVDELSSTIGEVARQIGESAKYAEQASTLTRETGVIMQGSVKAMSDASAAMDEITVTSKNISKVIKTIDDIAFQTNILALNAAVEAARAGAAGKGFAVVADEVRNLSQKSAEAAKSTTGLIETSIVAVEKGGKLVGKASDDFSEVAKKSEEVNTIVGELAEQFQQQAVATSQISQGIEQVASVIQMNSATSEESAAASEELSSQANVLKDLVSQFRLTD